MPLSISRNVVRVCRRDPGQCMCRSEIDFVNMRPENGLNDVRLPSVRVNPGCCGVVDSGCGFVRALVDRCAR